MLLIDRAHLDFLQSEKISEQQKMDTTRNLINDIFRVDRISLAEIERTCGFFPGELKKWSGECDALGKSADDLDADIGSSRMAPDLAALSPIWEDTIQPLVTKFEASQSEQRESVVSQVIKRYDDALVELKVNKASVIASWRRLTRIIAACGIAVITLVVLAFYQLSTVQSGTEAIVIGAAGNALWGFLCWLFQKLKSDDKSWMLKSKRGIFEKATSKTLDEIRRIELMPPMDLVELQDQCRARLATALAQLVVGRTKLVGQLAGSLIPEIDTVRRSGRATVEAYRREWENARAITEKLYQESDDKADKFNMVATGFKERTMDRTRELFGTRGEEFDKYSNLLRECVTALRESH
jgi:hypothetical protein